MSATNGVGSTGKAGGAGGLDGGGGGGGGFFGGGGGGGSTNGGGGSDFVVNGATGATFAPGTLNTPRVTVTFNGGSGSCPAGPVVVGPRFTG